MSGLSPENRRALLDLRRMFEEGARLYGGVNHILLEAPGMLVLNIYLDKRTSRWVLVNPKM